MKQVNKKISWKFLIISTLFLLVCITQVYSLAVTTDKTQYSQSELVLVSIITTFENESADLTTYSLSLSGHGLNQYYGSITSTEFLFTPRHAGEYTISLHDINSSLVNSTIFEVLSNQNATSSTQPYSHFATDKTSYLVGERVIITFYNLTPGQKLVINSEASNYEYLGIINNTISFYPQIPGPYTIQLLDENNTLVEEQRIQVRPDNQNSTNNQTINGNSFGHYLRDHNGNLRLITLNIEQTVNFSQLTNVTEIIATLEQPTNTIESIEFVGLNISNSFDLGVEDLNTSMFNSLSTKIVSAYAIDPTRLEFVSATVSAVAKGFELYKCAEWNFSEQRCDGLWVKQMDLIAGQVYNFNITPNDPAYVEITKDADACFNEQAGATCTSGELTAIQTDDNNYYPFYKNTNTPIRVSFADVSDFMDQIVECTVEVKGLDTEGNTWNLQLGNYTENTWGSASGQSAPTIENWVYWDCLSYFATGNDLENFNDFGVRIASADTGKGATGSYIDAVKVTINYSLLDQQAPTYSLIETLYATPTVYGSAKKHQFNTTWTDNELVDAVQFEHNFWAPLNNYSVTGNTSSEYFYDVTTLAVGTYQWRTYANDSVPNNNWTSVQTYTITEATPSANLLLNGTDGDYTINETQWVNMTGIRVSGEGNIVLYVDGVLYNNNTLSVENLTQFNDDGLYNITLKYFATQNYTSIHETHWLQVDDVLAPGNITNLAEQSVGQTWINWTWTNPIDDDFAHIEVWIDGVFQENITNTTSSYNATDLASETQYELQLRPVDSVGNIGYWTKDNATTLASADVTPPSIQNITNISITDSSANLTWDTDENADSIVFYGTQSGVYNNNITDISFVTQHNIYLSSLLPSTTYYYIVNSTDQAGNSNQSIEYSFSTLADATAPQWSDVTTYPTTPTNYDPAGSYQFNVTWTDNGQLDVVQIEHDFFGVLDNYSISGNVSSEYYYNIGSLAAGSYSWKMYANDSEDNTGVTGQFSYQVQKIPASIQLLLNNTDGNYIINETQWANITGLLLTGQGNITLYVDDSLIANGSSPLINISQFNTPGNYVVNVTYRTTQNYSFNSSVHTLTVNDVIAPEVNLTTPIEGEQDVDGDLTFYFNVTDTGVVTNCSLFINDTFNKTKSIATQGINSFSANNMVNGAYDWRIECNDTAGNNGISQTRNFTVFINEFYPQIYPVLCSQETGTCDVTLVNVSDAQYEEHSWVDRQDRDNYAYFNFTNPNIPVGATIHWINFTHQKYQEYDSSDGFYEMDWYNITSGTWSNLCQQTSPTLTTPPSYDPVICNFNTTQDNFPTVTQINDGLQLRARWYYSGGDASNKYYGTNFIQVYLKYTEDVTPPTVDLVTPTFGAYLNKGTVTFTYEPSDNNLVNCSLWGDFNGTWAKNQTNNTVNSEQTNSFWMYLTEGYYNWNVQCYDVATNNDFALQSYTLNITNPDIVIRSSSLRFSDVSPTENQNISINATITNIGNVNNTEAFKVGFYLGDPELGGVQIDGNTTISELNIEQNITVNTTWIVTGPGPFNFFVAVDIPLQTNGSVDETDETNNKQNRVLNVPSWHYTYGKINNTLVLAKFNNKSIDDWLAQQITGNIYVLETGRNIGWTQLQALSRTISDSFAQNDFEDLDTALSSTAYNDSVNYTYTVGGAPKNTVSFDVFGATINNVPYVESTNNTNFVTGILWDYGDGGTQYNGAQDVVFVTKINQSKQGKYGIVDYEIRFPTNLRDNLEGSYDTVDFYYELK
ncbi:hypothetical protein GOV04_03315 [Candidatus Woesearchaeota archaeon]|nr:hypothetical protein [Candidatus Woesearchaeota archaeon]